MDLLKSEDEKNKSLIASLQSQIEALKTENTQLKTAHAETKNADVTDEFLSAKHDSDSEDNIWHRLVIDDKSEGSSETQPHTSKSVFSGPITFNFYGANSAALQEQVHTPGSLKK